jgi:hypothetical protein
MLHHVLMGQGNHAGIDVGYGCPQSMPAILNKICIDITQLRHDKVQPHYMAGTAVFW